MLHTCERAFSVSKSEIGSGGPGGTVSVSCMGIGSTVEFPFQLWLCVSVCLPTPEHRAPSRDPGPDQREKEGRGREGEGSLGEAY